MSDCHLVRVSDTTVYVGIITNHGIWCLKLSCEDMKNKLLYRIIMTQSTPVQL